MNYNRTHNSGWRSGFGLVLAVITILIHKYAPASLIEALYGKGLFKWVRLLLDHTVALIPIPFFYVMVGVLLFLLLRFIRKIRSNSKRGVRQVLTFTFSLLNFLGWIVFAFYWLWGFNYDREPLEEKLGWQQKSFSNLEFEEESIQTLALLGKLRVENSNLVQDYLADFNYASIESTLRDETSHVAQQIGYASSQQISCRQLVPKGILLRFGTAGFYNPFTGECNIDEGLHPLQKPFVVAHEFFHGLGVSGEGDCNFLAYITCYKSTDPFIRYSGQLGYWRYLRRGFYRSNPEKYEEHVSMLPEPVLTDLEEIDATIRRYPDLAPRMRDAMYNAYLKTNKIVDGMANYHQIVPLVMAWRANDLKIGRLGK